jgi:hypothetical protein
MRVVVSITLSVQTIHHRASRQMKHMSVIARISAAGESLTPYIVTSQDSDSLRTKLMRRGVRLGVDLVLQKRSKPYVNRTLFLDYINSVVIPYVNELGESEELYDCQWGLLMDNCSAHMADEVIMALSTDQK